jgi:hypothetical protein
MYSQRVLERDIFGGSDSELSDEEGRYLEKHGYYTFLIPVTFDSRH